MNKIAIIEDDIDICNMIAKFLENNKYIVHYALNGAEGIELCKSLVPDLIILDIMLPKLNGNDVLQRLRKFTNAPVIVVSAKTMVQTKIDLLKLGADDYIVKPFDSKELIARVKSVLRRSETRHSNVSKKVILPNLVINQTTYTVIYHGKELELPPKEFELLSFLAKYPNQVFKREELLDKIWGYEFVGDTRTVDVHIKRLREKMQYEDSWSIKTVWGVGYKFEVKNN